MALSAQEKSFGVWGRLPGLSGVIDFNNMVSLHLRVFSYSCFLLLLLLVVVVVVVFVVVVVVVVVVTFACHFAMTSFALGLYNISHAHTHAQLPTKSGISLVYPATNNSHNKDYSIFSREDPRCIILRLEGAWKCQETFSQSTWKQMDEQIAAIGFSPYT